MLLAVARSIQGFLIFLAVCEIGVLQIELLMAHTEDGDGEDGGLGSVHLESSFGS